MSNRNLRLNIAYHGKKFSGFQAQENVRTVEQELKKAFFTIFRQNVSLRAAGRTDAGVHALNQVASVKLSTDLSLYRITRGLAAVLPRDLSIWRIDEMPLGFDARSQSIGKKYTYNIYQGLVPDPFLNETTLFLKAKLDVKRMQAAASLLIGEHDFESFRAKACTAIHARRFLWHVAVDQKKNLISIDVYGNAFCLNMVRIISGTLIEVGLGKREPSSIKDILLHKDRRSAGISAKPQGLTLACVYYPDDFRDSLIPNTARFPRFPPDEKTWPFSDDQIILGPVL